MPSFPRQRIRLAAEASQKTTWVDAFTGEAPKHWRNTALQFEVGFFLKGELIDMADVASITLEVKEADDHVLPALMSRTISAAEFNLGLTSDQWTAGTGQHVTIAFTSTETALDLGGKASKKFWLVVRGISLTGERNTYGAANITFLEDGSSADETPALGASLIPALSSYDAAGEFVLDVQQNKVHRYTPGANDASVANGTQVLAGGGDFIAQDESVTLTGTPNALITATINYPVYLTADEVLAQIQGTAKLVNGPGVVIVTKSPSNTYMRLQGVNDDGSRLDQVLEINPA